MTTGYWRLDNCPFQVQKTYCISIQPRSPGNRQPPDWRNHVFSDLFEVPVVSHKVVCQKHKTDGGRWRQGYYGERKWDLQRPQKNKKNTMMTRHEAQERDDIEDVDYQTQWERTTLAIVRRQALRRARRQRVTAAIRQRIDAALQEEEECCDASDHSDVAPDQCPVGWSIDMIREQFVG